MSAAIIALAGAVIFSAGMGDERSAPANALGILIGFVGFLAWVRFVRTEK